MSKEQFKVIVAGSRGFTNYPLMRLKLDKILSVKAETHDIVIVSGTAKGADILGEKYAKEKGYEIIRMPAQWDTYGKRAGFIRNKKMAEISDACVIFWDGESKGSFNMYWIAEDLGLITRLIKY